MAGIGFRLNKYFKESNLLKKIEGTLYSIIISSGPWLITVLSIATISYYIQNLLEVDQVLVFKSIVCYTYAFSLIVFGAIEMPITRYLADNLYIEDTSTFRTVYFSCLMFGILLAGGSAGLFYYHMNLPPTIKIAGITFFAAVLAIWISMIFLSAAKRYHQIVIAFLLGGILSTAGSIYLGSLYGLEGYMFGFTGGQSLIAILLSLSLYFEFSGPEFISYRFLGYFSKYRSLVFVGLFYYIGIWVDKLLFWFSSTGEQVQDLLWTNRYYDTASFLAYLTIVPALAFFMVQVETNFYVKYSYYFKSIDSQNDLRFLETCREDIILSLRNAFARMFKFQAFITVIIWYFSHEIITFLRLPALMETIFKYCVLGSLLQVFFLIMNIVLLYFEDRKGVLINYGVFFLTNAVFTYITIGMGHRYYGLGYLLSCFITFSITFLRLNKALKDLHMNTFMRQPLSRDNLLES